MLTVTKICEIFDIEHPLRQSTCIGYGQRSSTCGNAVAISSRQTAIRWLQEIAHSINETGLVSQRSLQTLAGLLLCKRNHQWQTQEKAETFEDMLKGSLQQTHHRIRSSSGQHNTHEPQQNRAIGDCSIDDLLAEIARRSGSRSSLSIARSLPDAETNTGGSPTRLSFSSTDRTTRNIGALGTVRSVEESVPTVQRPCRGTAAHVRHDARERGESTSTRLSSSSSQESEGSQEVPASPASEDTNGTSSSISTSTSTSSDHPISPTSLTEQTLESQTSVTTRNAADPSTTLNTTDVETSVPQATPDTDSSPIEQEGRSSHSECGICMENYTDTTDTWECRHCMNRVHTECFDTWAASQADGVVKCVYCRGRVRNA